MARFNRASTTGTALQPVFPIPVQTSRVPTTTDIKFAPGQVWLDTSTGAAYMLGAITGGAAQWNLLGANASDIDTINGLLPTAANIVVDGGTNITDVNAGSTVTLNLDDAITVATSVTSPLYTAPTDVDVTINSVGMGEIRMTSADGFGIDAVSGVSINASGGNIGLGGDADSFNIEIGNGASERTITIGNATLATEIIINSGTGHITLTSTGALADIILDADNDLFIDADGVLELNSSAGVIGIGNDPDAQNINIGTGVAARAITIGNVTGTTSVAINTGTAGFAATTTGAGTIALTSGSTMDLDTAGILSINSSAGAINVGNDANAFAMNVGTGAAARTITIGNATGATSVVVNSGTGAASFASNATVHATTVGSSTGASSTTIQAGTAGVLLVSDEIQLSSGGDVSMSPATNSVAGASLTLNARVGVATFTGLTTASGADVDLVITNSELTQGQGVFCTVSNIGSNDADIALEGVITETAGTLTLHCINQGPAALNGDIIASFWLIN